MSDINRFEFKLVSMDISEEDGSESCRFEGRDLANGYTFTIAAKACKDASCFDVSIRRTDLAERGEPDEDDIDKWIDTAKRAVYYAMFAKDMDNVKKFDRRMPYNSYKKSERMFESNENSENDNDDTDVGDR